jgi:hypothetical protein
MLLYVDVYSRISVDGVPGYAAATFTPASYAPLAIASLPVSIAFVFSTLAQNYANIFIYFVYQEAKN